MALSPGTRLGHYDVTALIGEAGMGQVWQAIYTQFNRQVALQILPDDFATAAVASPRSSGRRRCWRRSTTRTSAASTAWQSVRTGLSEVTRELVAVMGRRSEDECLYSWSSALR